MEIKAHAKINLCLNVVGRRDDGYHELEMVMVPLTLHDTIDIELSDKDEYSCSDQSLPMDLSNTVVKAVELMRKTYGFKEHFKIHIQKEIPAQAGLAGGSADAAAVMKAIKELLKIDISIEELSQLGKQVGADVPFCVMETCALVKGIGEKIVPFSMPSDFYILLVKPSLGVPTGKAFSMLDFDKCDHPDCNEVIHVLKEGKLDKLASVISNSLEYSAFQIVPENGFCLNKG